MVNVQRNGTLRAYQGPYVEIPVQGRDMPSRTNEFDRDKTDAPLEHASK